MSQRGGPRSFYPAMSIKLMSRVWDETRFKGTELLVLLCLADHANDEGICWPSYEKLALRARCSRRQAIRCLISLKAEGWVEMIGKKRCQSGQYTNLFQIQVPARGDTASLLSRGAKIGKRGDMEGQKGVTWVSPKPSEESSKEPPLRDDDPY